MANNLVEFIKAAGKDTDLQEKIQSAFEALPAERTLEDEADMLVALGKEAGYEFTSEDCINLKNQLEGKDGEYNVSTDELEQLAGGGVGLGGGLTWTTCSGVGAGITINITSSGGGFCIAVGGGVGGDGGAKDDQCCLLVGVGS